jgi:predicted molibdopterin-dependent oxidoreductase YjgC
VNDVIGYAFRGPSSKIVFDFDDAMGESTCVACGECVQACPTGALAPAKNAYKVVADKKVDSVCPYCGVGCQLTYHVKDNAIVRVDGRDGPANRGLVTASDRLRSTPGHGSRSSAKAAGQTPTSVDPALARRVPRSHVEEASSCRRR